MVEFQTTQQTRIFRAGSELNAHRLALPSRRRGFTLMEILTVIAILGILASITITAGRGIQERGKIAKAKAELAVIGAALEQYKAVYGDYPWTPDGSATTPAVTTASGWTMDGGAILINALCGNLGPTGNQLPAKGRTFLELAKFTPTFATEGDAEEALPESDSTDLKENWLNDPWGKWYYYHYKKGSSDSNWVSPSFLLYSHGPDGQCNIGAAAESSGILMGNWPTDDASRAKNADNVYFGRN